MAAAASVTLGEVVFLADSNASHLPSFSKVPLVFLPTPAATLHMEKGTSRARNSPRVEKERFSSVEEASTRRKEARGIDSEVSILSLARSAKETSAGM